MLTICRLGRLNFIVIEKIIKFDKNSGVTKCPDPKVSITRPLCPISGEKISKPKCPHFRRYRGGANLEI